MPLLAGVGCGVLSAWGIGGGTLLLLVMTLAFGVDQAAAQGINLLYFLPTAAMGLIWHRQNGLLDKAVLRRTVPWALATAAAGAWAELRPKAEGTHQEEQGEQVSGRFHCTE